MMVQVGAGVSTSNGKEKLVLFDAGGVLVQLAYSDFYTEAAMLSGKMNPDGFRRAYFTSNLEADALNGKISSDELLRGVRKIVSPDSVISEQEIRKAVCLCWKRQIDEVVDIKRRLNQAGYSVGIFSNTHQLFIDNMTERFPEMLETYDEDSPRIFSFRVGSMKPDRPMYEQIEQYRKVVLIDDKESYLKTAVEKFGWKGILLTPYVDESEAIRSVAEHSSKAMPLGDFRIANSSEKLEEALRSFGFEF